MAKDQVLAFIRAEDGLVQDLESEGHAQFVAAARALVASLDAPGARQLRGRTFHRHKQRSMPCVTVTGQFDSGVVVKATFASQYSGTLVTLEERSCTCATYRDELMCEHVPALAVLFGSHAHTFSETEQPKLLQRTSGLRSLSGPLSLPGRVRGSAPSQLPGGLPAAASPAAPAAPAPRPAPSSSPAPAPAPAPTPAADAAVPGPPSSSSLSWACDVCTLRNAATAAVCRVCNTVRGGLCPPASATATATAAAAPPATSSRGAEEHKADPDASQPSAASQPAKRATAAADGHRVLPSFMIRSIARAKRTAAAVPPTAAATTPAASAPPPGAHQPRATDGAAAASPAKRRRQASPAAQSKSKPRATKKKKGAPRGRSAWMFFLNDNFERLRQELKDNAEPGVTIRAPDVAKAASALYKNLSAEERAVYDAKAQASKEEAAAARAAEKAAAPQHPTAQPAGAAAESPQPPRLKAAKPVKRPYVRRSREDAAALRRVAGGGGVGGGGGGGAGVGGGVGGGAATPPSPPAAPQPLKLSACDALLDDVLPLSPRRSKGPTQHSTLPLSTAPPSPTPNPPSVALSPSVSPLPSPVPNPMLRKQTWVPPHLRKRATTDATPASATAAAPAGTSRLPLSERLRRYC